MSFGPSTLGDMQLRTVQTEQNSHIEQVRNVQTCDEFESTSGLLCTILTPPVCFPRRSQLALMRAI